MKIIKVNHKTEWGISIKLYSFIGLKKIEYNDRFSSIKILIDFDLIEGTVEKFDLEKFEIFAKSNEKSVFEICIE